MWNFFLFQLLKGQFVGPLIWQLWAALLLGAHPSSSLFFRVLFKELIGLVPVPIWPFVLFCLLDLPKSAHKKKGKKKKIYSNIHTYIYIHTYIKVCPSFGTRFFKKSSSLYNSALPFLRYLLHLSGVLAITFCS